MDRIQTICYDLKNDTEIAAFVAECEASFFRQVDDCADEILARGSRFIALSGPTCSGKTTASERICNEFASRGIRVKTISIDDFYIARDILLKRAEESGTPIDFDSPATIDMALLASCVEKLRRGEVVELPKYNFVKGCYEAFTPFCGQEADIFLFEGIQAIYPGVREILEQEDLVSVFIRPSSSIQAGGELFESHELRFARRLVRDFRFRGAKPEYTFVLWEGVRANEKKHIEPFEASVDMAIDSTMVYEPAVIRDSFVGDLKLVPKDNPYYEKAQALIREYDHIPSIPTRFVPKNSIFREFIGQED